MQELSCISDISVFVGSYMLIVLLLVFADTCMRISAKKPPNIWVIIDSFLFPFVIVHVIVLFFVRIFKKWHSK